MIWALAALFCLLPGVASADPLTAIIASGLSSIGITGLAGQAIASLLGSALLSSAARAIAGKSKSVGAATALELQQPTSQPPFRFVYGNTRAAGTPTGLHVKGNILYGCWIVNSRPSEGPFTLQLDKRPVTVTGDPYDFTGSGGATATAAPFTGLVKMWIGKGAQTTAPAQIVSEAPEFYASTDGWQGLTVVWLRLDCGDAASRGERWISAPPEVALDGKFSRVWDPRDGAQSQASPATWTWSANQALAILDALLNNPLTPYDLRQVDLSSLTWAADVADEAAAVKAGGTTPRYEVNGTIVFSEGAELEDQLQPLLDAGASQWARARGQLGVIPATVQDSALTLADMLTDEPPTFVRYRPRDELFTEVSATYLAPDRAYEGAEAPVFVVTGAQSDDGGLARRLQPDLSMITDHRQAQRVQKILVMRTRAQRVITATFPPAAFQVVAGSWVTLDLPAPFIGWNGMYQVESLRPAIGGNAGDGGVHLRCSLTLREVSSAIYAWTPASEEQDVATFTLDGTLPPTAAPGAVTTTTGSAVAIWTGTAYTAAIRFAFNPSASASVVSYEWQYQADGGPWAPGGFIDGLIRDGGGQVFGFLQAAAEASSYVIRVRAIGSSASAWVSSSPVVASLAGSRWDANFAAASYAIAGASVAIGGVIAVGRGSIGTYLDNAGVIQTAAANVARLDYTTGTRALLIEPASTNQALHAADINNAAWIATSAGKAAVSSIIAGYSACSLTEVAATANHVVRQDRTITASQAQAVTVIAKAGSGAARWLAVSMHSAADATKWVAARFDLSGGTVASTDATGAGYTLSGATITALGGGWYQCVLAGVISTATDFRARIGLASASATYSASQGGSQSYAGDGSSNIILAGVQFEDAATGSSFIPTTTAAVTRAAEAVTMQGITGTLDLIATYGDGSTAAFDAAPVVPGYWPALTQKYLRRLVGTI